MILNVFILSIVIGFANACDVNQHIGCLSCNPVCNNIPDPNCYEECADKGCICDDGFVWDSSTETCVKPQQCPEFCGANATYAACSPMVPERCPWPPMKNFIMGRLVNIAMQMCGKEFCACKEGFLLTADQKCVKPEDCPQPIECPEYQEAAPATNCPRTCFNYMDRNFVCHNRTISIQCVCEKGRLFDAGGNCVLIEDCLQTVPLENQVTVDESSMNFKYDDKMNSTRNENSFPENSDIRSDKLVDDLSSNNKNNFIAEDSLSHIEFKSDGDDKYDGNADVNNKKITMTNDLEINFSDKKPSNLLGYRNSNNKLSDNFVKNNMKNLDQMWSTIDNKMPFNGQMYPWQNENSNHPTNLRQNQSKFNPNYNSYNYLDYLDHGPNFDRQYYPKLPYKKNANNFRYNYYENYLPTSNDILFHKSPSLNRFLHPQTMHYMENAKHDILSDTIPVFDQYNGNHFDNNYFDGSDFPNHLSCINRQDRLDLPFFKRNTIPGDYKINSIYKDFISKENNEYSRHHDNLPWFDAFGSPTVNADSDFVDSDYENLLFLDIVFKKFLDQNKNNPYINNHKGEMLLIENDNFYRNNRNQLVGTNDYKTYFEQYDHHTVPNLSEPLMKENLYLLWDLLSRYEAYKNSNNCLQKYTILVAPIIPCMPNPLSFENNSFQY